MNIIPAVLAFMASILQELQAQRSTVKVQRSPFDRDALANILFALHPAQSFRLAKASKMPTFPLETKVSEPRWYQSPISMNDEEIEELKAEDLEKLGEEADSDAGAGDDETIVDAEATPSEDDDSSTETADDDNSTVSEKPAGPPHVVALETAKKEIADGVEVDKAFVAVEEEMKKLVEQADLAKSKEFQAVVQKEQTLEKFTALGDKFQAEQRSYERRVEMKIKETKSKLLKSLFPVLDNMDRAANAIKPENEGEEKINNEYKRLIEDIVETFKNMGVQVVGQEIEGTQFDFETQEAITMVPTEDYPDNTVMMLSEKGYMFEGSLLRPAQVIVAQNDVEREEKRKQAEAEAAAKKAEEEAAAKKAEEAAAKKAEEEAAAKAEEETAAAEAKEEEQPKDEATDEPEEPEKKKQWFEKEKSD
jgi:molecular chaperone GrpE